MKDYVVIFDFSLKVQDSEYNTSEIASQMWLDKDTSLEEAVEYFKRIEEDVKSWLENRST